MVIHFLVHVKRLAYLCIIKVKQERTNDMTTQKYNKSEIMKEAHRLYKECKRYGRSFGNCLKQAWASAKNMAMLAIQRAAFQKELEERWRNNNIITTHTGMSSL